MSYRRTAGVAAVTIALTIAGTAASSADSAAETNPHWTMGATQPSAGLANSSNVTPDAAPWECEGVAFTPGIVKDSKGAPYVHFSAKQTCQLAYGTQRVCTALEEFYGNDYHQLTTFRCSSLTASSYYTANGTVSCASLGGSGVYRSVGEGYAYPDGVSHFSGIHDSDSAKLC